MAEENLGTAVLKIVVDDDQARTALKLLKRDVESAGISKSTTSSSSRQTKSERDLEVIKEKRFRLARRIEALEDKGVNVSRLRTQLGRLTTAYAERDFTLARNTARELARQATLAERTEKRRARAARNAKAEADESIRSARGLNRVNIDGSLRDVGSPRFVTRGAGQGGQAESINALTAAQKRRYSLDQQIRSLEASGVRTDQLRVRLGEVTTAQANRQFGTFNRLADTLDFTLRKERDKLKVLQDQNREYERIGKLNVAPVRGGVAFPGSPAALEAQQREGIRTGRLNAAPVRGGKAFPGSPEYLKSIFPSFPKEYFAKQAREVKAASQKQQGIISNAIIGGAFPLLFGQGIGASIGGAAGGAAGGAIGGQFGFGLSLVGTALGSQFDVAIQKSGELAKALDNPIAQFGALQQNALLSSKGLEKQIQSLIASGREAEAAALIQEDLNKLFGDAEGAKEYQNAVDRLNRSYSQATVTLTNFVVGPLADFLERIVGPTRNTQLSARIISEKATLDPQQRKQFAAFAAEERRRQNLGPLPSSLQVTELYVALLGEINRLQGKNNTALATAAGNQKILTQSAQTLVGLEAAINRARISGNKPLEESITLQQELLKNYRERKNIEQQLAAKQITSAQATERTRQSFEKDTALQQNYVNSTRQSAANAVKELQTTKQLSGLEGVRLEVARKRLEIDDAANAAFLQRTEFIKARERLSAQPTNLNRVLAQGAFQELATAGVQFETKLRQAADYLAKAAKDAAQNLTTAILNLGKLEADPAGLNRFLTPNEQFESTRKAILRLGTQADGSSQLENAITKATELLGLTRGQANERFQGLRDIFAQARQGVFASQEGFNTLSSFIEDTRAREQAVTGLDDAQKTLTDVTALSASVQQELVGAVRENSVLLNSLFGKDWNVNVSVSGAEANVSGDAINRQLSP